MRREKDRPLNLDAALERFEADLTAFVDGNIGFADYEWRFEQRYRADMDLYDRSAREVLGPYRIQSDSAVADDPDPERGEISVEEIREITRQLLADWRAGLL